MVINCGSSKKLLTDLYGREKQVKINQDIFLIVTQIIFFTSFVPLFRCRDAWNNVYSRFHLNTF